MNDDGIGKYVREIFEISCIKISRYLKYNKMQVIYALQNTLNIPIIQLSQNADLESLYKWFAKTVKGNLKITA